jgi:CrcB protein
VNVIGSFVLSLLLSLPARWVSPELRLFAGAGFLGGFTTYSSFNHETLALVESGSGALAFANVAATLASCLAAGLAGLAAGRWLAG